MIKVPRSKEMSSLVLATIGVVVLGIAGWFGFNQLDDVDQDDYEPPLSLQDKAANLASAYVKSLPLYKQDENPTLLLTKTELLEPEMWLVQYNLSSAAELSYELALTVQEGQVIHHSINSQDQKGSLILFEPEPDEIITGDAFLIKGSSLNGEDVVITLLNEDGVEVLSHLVKSTDLKDNLFSQRLNVNNVASGNYQLQLISNNVKLAVPVVISPKV